VTSEPGRATPWQDRYRDPSVVERYLADRFSSPLGALLHARQAGAVRRSIAALRSPRVLEVAAGPARFAAEIFQSAARSVFLDRSLPMLTLARSSLAAGAPPTAAWAAGDAFELPFRDASFDLLVVFRFLRHLDVAQRARCYRELGRVVRPGGSVLFDAVNDRVSRALRERSPRDYVLPDALYTEPALRDELATTELELQSLEPVQRRYWLERRLQILLAPRSRRLASWAIGWVERSGGAPLEWVVLCRRA
jgi:ubiquinone/menaquinone biosynthesis C-methylase UbiE